MERKFLAFSCLVLLISIVYFIYTSYQLHIENKNQQEVTSELETLFIAPWVADSVFQYATPEQAISEPIEGEGELEVFEQDFESVELEETEAIFDTGGYDEMEAETTDDRIDTLLEALFTEVEPLYGQQSVILREITPPSIELRKLKYRQIEIGLYDLVGASSEETKRLHEEFHRSQDRMQELRTIIAPLEEQLLQLSKEIKQTVFDYGMTVQEFDKRYGEQYKSWKSER